ncbi:MAG: DUF6152 family protein [Steroidobacteraceae bacterium]
MIRKLILSLVCATALVPAAQAHHSFAMFDMDKTVTLDATVESFKWAMPHVWLYVVIQTASGPQQWGMECHSPNIIARKGWTSKSVQPGDKVKVTMHPKRDGTSSGSLIYITLPDGTVLWNAESEGRV